MLLDYSVGAWASGRLQGPRRPQWKITPEYLSELLNVSPVFSSQARSVTPRHILTVEGLIPSNHTMRHGLFSGVATTLNWIQGELLADSR
jgi:hypothetical protein